MFSLDAGAGLSSHSSVRTLIRRLAAAVLVASLVSPGVMAFSGGLAPPRDVSPERGTGMNAPAGPEVSAFVVAVPAALGGPVSVLARVPATARLVAGERLSNVDVRPAFVVKSAPTILRV
jgi:hypothetical protein